jgi:hypothetical protein
MAQRFRIRRNHIVNAAYVAVVAACAAGAGAGLSREAVFVGSVLACVAIATWNWWADRRAPEPSPPPEEPPGDSRRSPGQRVRLREWTLLAVCLAFCVGCAIALFEDPTDPMGWAALAFFALCTLPATRTVLEGLRRQRFQATRVDVVEGVPIRTGGGAYMPAIGIGLTVTATAFLASPVPWPILLCAVVMGAAGLWLLGMIVTGKLQQRFLRFDPDGLTVAESGFQYRIAWANVTGLAEFEYAGVAFVGIALAREDAVPVTPAARTAKALKLFDRNRRTMGPPVVLAPMHFGIDAEVLAGAIATRIDDDRRRHDSAEAILAPPAGG